MSHDIAKHRGISANDDAGRALASATPAPPRFGAALSTLSWPAWPADLVDEEDDAPTLPRG